ncbi:MAG: hypothetical protein ABI781_11500 [Burkholderiales bacterium]
MWLGALRAGGVADMQARGISDEEFANLQLAAMLIPEFLPKE